VIHLIELGETVYHPPNVAVAADELGI